MKQALNKKSIAVLVSSLFSGGLMLAATTVVLSTSMITTAHAEVSQSSARLPIALQSDAGVPHLFNIAGTNKIVIDFYNVTQGEAEVPTVTSDNPLISMSSVKKVGERVRVIVDVKHPVKYSVTQQGVNYTLNLEEAVTFENVGNPLSKTAPVTKVETISPKIVLDTTPEQVVNHGLSAEEKARIIARVNASVNKDKRVIVADRVIVVPQISVNHVEIQHINIKKTEDKSAKITIDFNDPAFTPTITKSENNLIVDLKGVGVPAELQKNINAKTLGTVLQNVDVATQKGSGRLVLTQKDGWDYSVYQMDKRLVLEIKNAQDKVIEKTYKGKPLSLNFQNMDVRAIMQVIADFTGLNIMSSDSVQGALSIRLKDVPWDQALELVLEAKNLQKVQEGNVIWIATRQEIADKNKSQLELQLQKADLAPLKLEFFQLNHYKATDLKDVIEGKSTAGSGTTKPLGLISKRGSVGLDNRNNTIFVQDTEENLAEIRRIIKRLDIPTRQVLIEAKLVIATNNFERDLGAKFGIGGSKTSGNGNNSIGMSNDFNNSQTFATGPTTSNGATTIPGPNGSSGFNLPVTGGGALGFTILNKVLGNYLSFELSALEKNNLGKVISSPRLLTSDNKKATIKQGTQIPYTVPGTANSAPTVNFKDALLSLGVTPQVSPNGRIMLNLDISKDSVGQMISLPGGGQVPSIDTRSINTEVTVSDGQTVVLGGVYEVTSADDVSKVPFFGDIPFLGNLFKNKTKSDQKAELLIFITPHIVNDEDLDAINNNEAKAPVEIDLKK
jgi:type IV pilus assembly protein PilQ